MERTKRKPRAAAAVVRAFKPALGPAESAALKDALESEWAGTGIYTRLFEAQLARELGAPHVHATNSGTAALHLALRVLEVEGGEVITTPVTSVATNHAILYNRAVPVFCDVEPETGNIDPAKAAALIGPRTRAIVAVHLGHACDMDALLEAARRRRIPVLEDACACHAAGGSYKGRPLGTLGAAGCFSFGRFKGLTTLDGGAVAHANAQWRDRLDRLRRLGYAADGGAMGDVEELGYHYRMNDLAAVVGLSQLRRREALQRRCDEILARYRSGVRGLSFMSPLESKPYSRGVRAYAGFRVAGGRFSKLRRFLSDNGVEVNDPLFPNHRYALYRRYARRLPEAERFCAETLHLPYYPGLRDEEIDRILELLHRFEP